tara:strand:+ start:682 stop:2094 length:1413 start_codon:yes stop_codon:yes gene_type:complete
MKYYLKLLISSVLVINCSPKISLNNNQTVNDIPGNWISPYLSEEISDLSWWGMFNDTTLNEMYTIFINKNHDLNLINKQLNISDQIEKIESSGSYPTVIFSNDVNASKNNPSSFGLSDDAFGGGSFESINYKLNLAVQWEVDLWGKLLNAKKAAKSKNLASIYDLKYFKFSLKTQFVKNYYQSVQSKKEYELALEYYKSSEKIRNLVKERYEKGLRSSIDLRLAESSLSRSKILLENKKIEFKSKIRSLELLLGKYPKGSIIISNSYPTNLPLIPIGLPVDLIERRPDVQAELKKLESKGFSLAQSKRDRLPSIFLTSSSGTSSNELKNILSGDYSVWNIVSNISTPIFQAGRIKSNIRIKQNEYEIAKVNYIKKVLVAFSEVENLLFIENSLKIQSQEIMNNVEQTFAAYKLAVNRYESGISDILTVINLQQQWINAKTEKIKIENLKINVRLNLLLALGGDFYNEKKE